MSGAVAQQSSLCLWKNLSWLDLCWPLLLVMRGQPELVMQKLPQLNILQLLMGLHTRDVVLRAHLGAGESSGSLVGRLLHLTRGAESKAGQWMWNKLTIYLVKFKKLQVFFTFHQCQQHFVCR